MPWSDTMTVFTSFEGIISSGKKYQIILADCPWPYKDKLQHHGGGAESHYDVMSIEDICKLPVSNIADDNCIIFMWGTWPLLPECTEVMKSWGFTYKTIGFVWIKQYSTGKDVLGMGYYTRGNTEFCLIGVKGKPKIFDHSVSQLLKTEIGKHSKKPDTIRNKIIQICGDLPKIELFGRTRIHNWDTFGNDVKLQDQPLEVFS